MDVGDGGWVCVALIPSSCALAVRAAQEPPLALVVRHALQIDRRTAFQLTFTNSRVVSPPAGPVASRRQHRTAGRQASVP